MALVRAVLDASVSLCDDRQDSPIDLESDCEAVIFAIAEATANATAACYASALPAGCC